MKFELTKIEKNEIVSLIKGSGTDYYKQFEKIRNKIGDCDSIEKFKRLNISRMKPINRLKYLLCILDSNIDCMKIKGAIVPKFREELEYIKEINSQIKF